MSNKRTILLLLVVVLLTCLAPMSSGQLNCSGGPQNCGGPISGTTGIFTGLVSTTNNFQVPAGNGYKNDTYAGSALILDNTVNLKGNTAVTVGSNTTTNAITVGATFAAGSSLITPAGSGVRFLCISTTGVITSSASACVGT